MTKQYDMNDPLARAAYAIDGRWTILILAEFVEFNIRRFQDIQNALPEIGPNTLSGRLKHLEEEGIIRREIYETHPPRAHYVFTKKGRDLAPVIAQLSKWGKRNG